MFAAQRVFVSPAPMRDDPARSVCESHRVTKTITSAPIAAARAEHPGAQRALRSGERRSSLPGTFPEDPASTHE